MKKLLSTSLLCLVGCVSVLAQIVVNLDGTHSLVISGTTMSTILNPNGTTSQMFDHGPVSIVLNPDGTHSVVANIAGMQPMFNPTGPTLTFSSALFPDTTPDTYYTTPHSSERPGGNPHLVIFREVSHKKGIEKVKEPSLSLK